MASKSIIKHQITRSHKLATAQQQTALKTAAQAALRSYGQGHAAAAEAAIEKIFAIDPDQPDALHLKGLMALNGKDYQTAEACFSQAVTLQPVFPLAHYNRGNGFLETRQYLRAEASYLKAIDQLADFPEACGNLGLTYMMLGDDAKAIAYLTRTIALKPDFTHALNNMGNVLRRQGRPMEAAAFYNKAIISAPGFALGYNNLGNVLRDLGQLDKAIAAFRRARDLDPELAEAPYNLALALLLTGDFAAGWEGYRWRHQIPGGPPAARQFSQPPWDGGDVSGKTLYLYPEQGLGDTIQFCRYVPLVAQRGGKIILRVPADLDALLTSLAGVDSMVLETEPGPETFDVHASLLDLPRIFATDQDTIPWSGPYLGVGEKQAAVWADRIRADRGLRVGLVWAGNAGHENDRNRSMDPRILAPLSRIDGITLHSLQIGSGNQAKALFGDAIVDLAPWIRDWSDTAAAIRNLDLMISVDTSSAHLAGAMGSEVWTLLPYMPDWRWQLDRDDSPWYPTMRLFRQTAIGDWDSVVQRLVTALENRL
ncbi:MAG: tetratricopeptide repeat protein [Rhodospirillales bacterium]|nr:tetratricopeptide repeat protein [Rhodospirillales bacterium]